MKFFIFFVFFDILYVRRLNVESNWRIFKKCNLKTWLLIGETFKVLIALHLIQFNQYFYLIYLVLSKHFSFFNCTFFHFFLEPLPKRASERSVEAKKSGAWQQAKRCASVCVSKPESELLYAYVCLCVSACVCEYATHTILEMPKHS